MAQLTEISSTDDYSYISLWPLAFSLQYSTLEYNHNIFTLNKYSMNMNIYADDKI